MLRYCRRYSPAIHCDTEEALTWAMWMHKICDKKINPMHQKLHTTIDITRCCCKTMKNTATFLTTTSCIYSDQRTACQTEIYRSKYFNNLYTITATNVPSTCWKCNAHQKPSIWSPFPKHADFNSGTRSFWLCMVLVKNWSHFTSTCLHVD